MSDELIPTTTEDSFAFKYPDAAASNVASGTKVQ